MIDHLGRQLKIGEHLCHCIQLLLSLGIARAMFGIQLHKLSMVVAKLFKVFSNFFRIRACRAFVLRFFLFFNFLTGAGSIFLKNISGFLRHR